MSIKVPTLSSSGWVGELAEKADKLLSYFFVSEASQTNLYAGRITSLPNLLKNNAHDDFDLRTAVQSALVTYLERHFDAVEVVVTTKENTLNGEKGLDLELDILVVQDGAQHSLGRLVSTLNSSIMKIMSINNTGM